MASVLQVFLNFLCKLPCKLRFTRGFDRCFKSWAPFLAFLARRLGIWRPRNNGKGTFQRSDQAECSFPGIGARLDVVQDQHQGHAVACSNIPASARHPSPLDATVAVRQAQLANSSGATHPAPANLTANPQHGHPQAYPTSVFDAVIYSNRSCASFSIHSRASDRLSIIQSHSHESLHTPLGQPKGNPKAAHRQFGCGPSTDHLEVSSHSHASLRPTGVHSHHKGQSSTSVVVGIESPSTESLPRSNLVGSLPLQEEPYSTGSPTVHSSPASNPPDLPELSIQLTPTATSSISDFDLPPGRYLQLIISEQVPRYTKSATVQVNNIITPSSSYVILQTPREEILRN